MITIDQVFLLVLAHFVINKLNPGLWRMEKDNLIRGGEEVVVLLD